MHRLVLASRSLGSILVGYLILALTNMLFVIIWFVQPVAEWPLPAILGLGVPYTLLCAVGAGYVAAWIAGRRERLHALVLAGIMSAVIVLSLVLNVAAEPNSYKLIYMAVMAPAAVFGGNIRMRNAAGNRLDNGAES